MSRMEREMKEIEGLWVTNDSIKDVAEDAKDLARDFGRMMDLHRPINQKAIELDAAVRFSNPVQKLVKMVLADFGIKSEKDAREAGRAIEHAVEEGLENCPMIDRVRKAAERFVRFYARTV